ncbi:MAG: TSUP family transporter, partial [Bacteroidota bacterium]
GNSLAMTLVTGLVGVWLWKRKGVYEPRTWLNMGVPAGLVAVGLAWLLRQGAFYDAALFRLVFSSMLAMMLARNAWACFKVGAVAPEGQGKEPSAGGYALLGSLGGLFSALTGLGGGAVMVPALQSLGMRNQARINALSMGTISVMALSSTLFYAMTDQGGLAPCHGTPK